MVRIIWAYLQDRGHGDLGVTVDNTVSAARTGTREYWLDDAGKHHSQPPDYWVIETTADSPGKDASGWEIPGTKTVTKQAGAPDFWADDKKTPAKINNTENADAVAVVQHWQVSDQRENTPTGTWLSSVPAVSESQYLWTRSTLTFPARTYTHYAVGARGKADTTPGIPDGIKRYTATRPPSGWKHYHKDNLPDGWKHVAGEPVVLNWWSTHDLGNVINNLARSHDFDYLEHTKWAGNTLAHRLELGTIGSRKSHLRFAIGENIVSTPDFDASDYATDVFALGAGEGNKMVRAHTSTNRGLRRAIVINDRSQSSQSELGSMASTHLDLFDGEPQISQFNVINHPNAALGSFDVGDVIRIEGQNEILNQDQWLKIIEITIKPANTEVITITCTR